MKLTLILLSILLGSCVSGPKVLILNGFEKWVDRFEQNSQIVGNPVRVSNLIIEWDEKNILPFYVAGRCSVVPQKPPKILINRFNWQHANEVEKEMILFHELAHCVLFRRHTQEIRNGIPKSIMYPVLIHWKMYDSYYWDYQAELFGA